MKLSRDRLVPAFAVFDAVLALSQLERSMSWYRWTGLVLVIALVVLSFMEVAGRHVDRLVASAATLLAINGSIDFALGAQRTVDHVGLVALWLTAIIAWWMVWREARAGRG